MGKIRRGNLVFLSWRGDHGPRHVHVYRAGKLILDNGKAMKGKSAGKVLELIRQLDAEGLI